MSAVVMFCIIQCTVRQYTRSSWIVIGSEERECTLYFQQSLSDSNFMVLRLCWSILSKETSRTIYDMKEHISAYIGF